MNRSLLPLNLRQALLLCAALAGTPAAFALEPPEALGMARLPSAAQEKLRAAQATFRTETANATGLALSEAYGKLAFEYAQAGLHAPAESVFARAEQALPSDARWPYMRGLMLMALQRHADAQVQLERSIKLNPDYQAAYFNLSTAARTAGQAAAARTAIERAAARFPTLAAAPAALARFAMADERPADAVALLEKAISLDPQAGALYTALAEAHNAAGNASAAAAARAKAGSGMPAVADPLGDALLAQDLDPVSRARALLRSGAPVEARAALGPALSSGSADPELLTLAARIELSAGEFAAAKRFADRVLATAPANAGAMLINGLVAEQGKDDSQAQRLFQNAVAADSTNAEAHLYLGNSLMRQKLYARAADQYRILQQRMPRSFEMRARVLAATSAAGQCSGQLAELERAIGENPEDGNLLELFARAGASCATASAEQRQRALDRAQAIYDAQPAAEHCEALAMAMAAHGRFEEAIEYQAQALFEAARRGGLEGLGPMQAMMKTLEAKQRPRLPWDATHPLINPPRIGTDG